MARASQRVARRNARRSRVRRRIVGSEESPRLSVYRSLHHIYAQVISDDAGTTVAAASTQSPELRDQLKSKGNKEAARAVGKAIAERCLQRGIQKVVFDRNGFLYHGNVKALAQAAREAGLKF